MWIVLGIEKERFFEQEERESTGGVINMKI